MTGPEMVAYFKLLYDVNGAQAVAGFEDSEIYDFLNKSQENFVSALYYNKQYESIRELLKVTDSALSSYSFYGYGCYVPSSELPSDYMFYVSSNTELTRTYFPKITVAEFIENIEIQDDEKDRFIVNSGNKTIFFQPRVLLLNVIDSDTGDALDKFRFFVDYYTTPASVVIEYVSTPTDIDGTHDCMLHEKFHRAITEKAVELAMITISDPRVMAKLKSENNDGR